MEITTELKDVYGKTLCYPKGACAFSIMRLTGKKTLDKSDLEALRELGHKIVFVSNAPNDWQQFTEA